MIRSLSRVVRAALVLLIFLFGAATWAKTAKVDVTYDLDADGCVTKIKVDPKDIKFSSLKHVLRGFNTKVHWKLDHEGKTTENTDWFIEKVSATYSICENKIEFAKDLARCEAETPFLGASQWEYKVVAEKFGCEAAVVDPEIIFKKGLLRVIILLIVLLAAAAGGLYWAFRVKRASS